MRSTLLPIASLAVAMGVGLVLLPDREDGVALAASDLGLEVSTRSEDQLAPGLPEDDRRGGTPAPAQETHPAGALLAVQVIDQLGDPVPHAPVLLRAGGQPERFQEADLEGRARFAGLDGGKYVLGIADGRTLGDTSCDHGERSLPRGYWFDEDAQVVVELEANERLRKEVTCERGAVLYGTLTAADGREGWGVVHARSEARGRAGRAWDTETDRSTGTFCMTVPPGSFRISFEAPEPWDEAQPPNPWAPLVRPAPVMLKLEPGQTLYLDRAFGPLGGTRVAGRVVDQAGDPWPAIEAHAYLQAIPTHDVPGSRFTTTVHRIATDGDGFFELGPLPPGEYGVTFAHPDHDQTGPGGLGEYPDPLRFTVDGEDRLDLGPQVLYRWESFTVAGQLLVGDGRTLGQVQVALVLPSSAPRRKAVRVEADGSFTVETSSHRPGVLTFVLSGPDGDHQRVLELIPSDEPVPLILRYP